MTRKIFMIACEPSGDLHAAHLVEHLKTKDPALEFAGLGGPQMAGQGVRLLYDMTRLSSLGLGDVLRQYFKYLRIFNQALREVREWKPDLLILIDSPAFNLRFAKKIKKQIPVLYYIAPQIWAWGKRRISTIQKTVHKMLVILPFEVPVYEKAGIPCEFTGHPLLDRITETHQGSPQNHTAIGLLSGSREKEVRRILPALCEIARELQKQDPSRKFIFFAARSVNVDRSLYESLLAAYPDLHVTLEEGPVQKLMASMDFALITSGTTTLEAALVGTPYFLFYKTGWFTYFLGKHLIQVPFLGLVNLLSGKSIVPEYIQDIPEKKVSSEILRYLNTPELLQGMKKSFAEIRHLLGEKGAGGRTAEAVLRFMESQRK